MSGEPLSKNDKLRALRQSYIAQLPAKLAQIQALWRHVQSTLDDDGQFDDLFRGVHSLAGSAGTFSFDRLGQLARETEQRLKHWREHRHEAQLIQTITELMAQLHASAAQGPEEKPAPPTEA